jgi:uncharacterized protein YjdB
VDIGETYFLWADVEPYNVGNSNVTWSSSNTAVATVTLGGLVRAVGTGTAIITARAADGSGVFDTCIVNVPFYFTTGVNLNKSNLRLLVGGSERLIATVLPASATNKNVTWTCDSPFVATVDQTGLVRAIGGGPANITVRTEDGGFIATCYVLVSFPVSKITIDPPTLTLRVGDMDFLWATVEPYNAGDTGITWSSSNTAFATVNQSGVVRGVASGDVTITATAVDGSGVTGTCSVKVTP